MGEVIDVAQQAVVVDAVAAASPGFVEGSPGDDAGVVAVALHHFLPFHKEIAGGSDTVDVHTPGGRLAPGEVA